MRICSVKRGCHHGNPSVLGKQTCQTWDFLATCLLLIWGRICACMACSGSSTPAILFAVPSLCVYLVLLDPHACNLHLTVPDAAHAVRTASYCLVCKFKLTK